MRYIVRGEYKKTIKQVTKERTISNKQADNINMYIRNWLKDNTSYNEWVNEWVKDDWMQSSDQTKYYFIVYINNNKNQQALSRQLSKAKLKLSFLRHGLRNWIHYRTPQTLVFKVWISDTYFACMCEYALLHLWKKSRKILPHTTHTHTLVNTLKWGGGELCH